MNNPLRIMWKPLSAAVGIAALSACATTPPPPPPPPPPPVVDATPYRPIPPGGAAYQMDIPMRGADGIRRTVNYGLNADETLWYFRSGWNVAALNCSEARYPQILEGYRTFLGRYDNQLDAANAAIDRGFRSRASTNREAIIARESVMTQVYNYFTLPSARGDFCATAESLALEMQTAPPADIGLFSAAGLQNFEIAFERFFQGYEQYQQLSADWDRRFGALYGASQPGYVAVYGSGGQPAPVGMVQGNGLAQAGQVRDPETGALIPILPATDESSSTPVVQPLPSGE